MYVRAPATPLSHLLESVLAVVRITEGAPWSRDDEDCHREHAPAP
jgi:hypothetical protein